MNIIKRLFFRRRGRPKTNLEFYVKSWEEFIEIIPKPELSEWSDGILGTSRVLVYGLPTGPQIRIYYEEFYH